VGRVLHRLVPEIHPVLNRLHPVILRRQVLDNCRWSRNRSQLGILRLRNLLNEPNGRQHRETDHTQIGLPHLILRQSHLLRRLVRVRLTRLNRRNECRQVKTRSVHREPNDAEVLLRGISDDRSITGLVEANLRVTRVIRRPVIRLVVDDLGVVVDVVRLVLATHLLYG
jgi:hypothetical protein